MKQYIGVPFENGEPTLYGANCITLIELFYKNELKIEIPKLRIDSSNTRRIFMEYMRQISENWETVIEPKEYDVVAMAHDLNHPKMIQHFGIYLGNGKMLHTLENVGSHIGNIEEYKAVIKGYYRWQP